MEEVHLSQGLKDEEPAIKGGGRTFQAEGIVRGGGHEGTKSSANAGVGRPLGPEHRGQREKVGKKHLEAGKGQAQQPGRGM